MKPSFSAMFSELVARRRRMRTLLGDRGASIAEFLLMAGVLMGSFGLLLGEWMPAAAPWGFALPFVLVLGFLLIEARRQAEIGRGAEADKIAARYDWLAQSFSFACAFAGAAAFVLAWSAKPAPEPALNPDWTPPESAVSADMLP